MRDSGSYPKCEALRVDSVFTLGWTARQSVVSSCLHPLSGEAIRWILPVSIRSLARQSVVSSCPHPLSGEAIRWILPVSIRSLARQSVVSSCPHPLSGEATRWILPVSIRGPARLSVVSSPFPFAGRQSRSRGFSRALRDCTETLDRPITLPLVIGFGIEIGFENDYDYDSGKIPGSSFVTRPPVTPAPFFCHTL